MEESNIHPPMICPDRVLPDCSRFHQMDFPSSVSKVSKILVQTSNQKSLALWCRSVSSSRKEFIRLQAAYSSFETRLALISPGNITGSHKPFDINQKFTIGYQPNAMFLPSLDDGMSQHQMSLYLNLILGLPVPDLYKILHLSLWSAELLFWTSPHKLQKRTLEKLIWQPMKLL